MNSLISIILLVVLVVLGLSLLKTSVGILPSLIKIAVVLVLIGFVYSLMPIK